MSTRQEKVSRLIQKELSMILQKMSGFLFPGKLVTVTKVRITPDLSQGKVYLSVFPSEGGQKTVDIISEHVSKIRSELGQKVRNQLRVVPEMRYFLDDSLDYIDNINELLK